jgi:hypothetical protein
MSSPSLLRRVNRPAALAILAAGARIWPAAAAPRLWYGGHHTIAHCVFTIGDWCPLESIGFSLLGTAVLTIVIGGGTWLLRRLGSPAEKKLPETLFFRSAAGAFEIYCKYGHIDDLRSRAPRPAMVKAAEIELLSDGRQWVWLLVADREKPFVVRAVTAQAAKPPLKGDELVQWLPVLREARLAKVPELAKDSRSLWLGFVAAIFAPEMKTATGQFRVVADYSAAIPPV